jgi:hypothetical protein
MPLATAERELQPWLINVSLVPHRARDAALSMACFRRYRPDRPAAERESRMQHHLAQWTHMATALRMLLHHERAVGMRYDLVLKLRDGTVAVSPLALSRGLVAHATSEFGAGSKGGGLREETTLSKKCVEWGGYNDKVMLITRRHVQAALGAPAAEVLNSQRCGQYRVGNSEQVARPVICRSDCGRTPRPCAVFESRHSNPQLLKRSLAAHGVLSRHVTRVPPTVLPLVDGRCSAQGTCLVESGKDCRPEEWQWSAQPCESLNVTDAQRLLYAQRWVPRRTLLPSLARSIDVSRV